MSLRWNILYRGPLSSCNYACDYCPFAKTKNTSAELADDAEKLQRFVDWVEGQKDRQIGILFTPWGEAMIHPAYQQVITRLSHMPNVYRVAIQTNLSGPVDWMKNCDENVAALWTTWHPSQVSLEKFTSRCSDLSGMAIRYSVGVVGLKEACTDIERLRDLLNSDVYLWINAFKRDAQYYSEDEISRLEEIDPLFRMNTKYHASLGKRCEAGKSAFTVDGAGDVRRCHFVEESPFANIYSNDELGQKLDRGTCPAESCGCHIGYTHLRELRQYEIYRDGLLERIPADFAVAGLILR